jgi:predicted ferric reductase
VPILGSSLAGAEPKVYWYLSRASGLTAFALLWASMASGLLISNKMARVWPGAFTAFDLHQFTSLLGLGFGLLHVVVLLGNLFVPYSLVQLLVPFADAPYRPLWVALGQVGLYLLIPVTFTFYIRRQIGNRVWRLIHFVSYAVFAMVLLHALFSGTDSGNIWVLTMYWATAASMLVLTMYRFTIKQTGLVRQ